MILGRSNQTNTITNEFEGIDYNISVESCDYVDIFVEATEEIAALESALYVADVMLEEHVLEGATNVDVLLEGVMSSMYSRLKAAAQKLWAKLKQWFANVKKYFQVLFTHGKDFVKKYKADIIKAEARAKGFKYDFYPVKGMESFSTKVPDKEVLMVSDAVEAARKLLTEGKSNSDIVKDMMKTEKWHGEDSQSEYNKKFRENLLGGDAKEEFEDFTQGPSVQAMIHMLETGADSIKVIDKTEKQVNQTFSKLITDLQKAENTEAKRVASESGATLDKAYSLAVEIAKAKSNHGVAVCNTLKEVVKTLMRDSESVLKRLLSHKPKKEGFEGADIDGHESILEAALKFI